MSPPGSEGMEGGMALPVCVKGVGDCPRWKGRGIRLSPVLRVLLGLVWVQARAEFPWVSVFGFLFDFLSP